MFKCYVISPKLGQKDGITRTVLKKNTPLPPKKLLLRSALRLNF